jgi:Ca2+:H+ antiporter
MPLERLFEYGGEQMQHYLGKSLGDLLKITLNK